ncbi:MAG: GtrA family protein [Actinomycetota bacterium]|nr:GtrA family protein [Actinomycetota bacterium]
MKELLSRQRSSRLGVRFGRYTLGSVVAVVASEVAFVGFYGSGLLGTTAASAVAFAAGAIPNYVLNRSWTWGRRGRVRVGREGVLYAAVSLTSFGASALATGWVSHLAPHLTASHALRTALVAAAYLGTYAVLFVAKFVVFQVVIFADAPSDAPPQPPS